MDYKRKDKKSFDYLTIDNDIRDGHLKQCYLLYGEEIYLLSQYRDKILKVFGADIKNDAMNVMMFEGKNFTVGELIEQADTLPFFADYRTIIVRDSGFFKTAQDKLDDYLKKGLPETTRIIFTESEVDGRNKLYKTVKELGRCVEFTQLDVDTLRKWVIKRLKDNGKNMTQRTFDLFMQRVGTDMSNISTELEKLICYRLNETEIRYEDVEEIVTITLKDRVFEMLQLMAERRQSEALHIYYELLSLRTPAYKILSIITGHFNQMMVAVKLNSLHYGQTAIADKLGYKKGSEWRVNKILGQSRGYKAETIKSAFEECIDYDMKIKTGRIADKLAVELLIVKYSS